MITTPPRGMRDFLPDEVRRRQYVIGVIADVYQRYGFEPLETPAVENIETLLGKYGEEGDRLIFKILKRGEGEASGAADLALRYDLTVPLARVVAEYRAKLPKFFKRYQVQPVWRADRPQKGRFREFYQCDVDAIGSSSPLVDAELCLAACEVLRKLRFTDFELHVNHREVLTGLLTGCGVPEERHGNALVALDKFDKVGLSGVLQELEDRGFEKRVSNALTGWQGVRWPKEWREWMVSQLPLLGDRGRAGAQNLHDIIDLLSKTEAESYVRVNPSLARGLSYYTGAIFEIRVSDLVGSLAGGGRYDNLIGMFLGEQIPACGISLGLERILVVMGQRGMFPEELTATAADVMLTIWNGAQMADTLALAAELRSAGLRVDVYPEADKLGKQFKYASSRGVPFVLVVGDDEAARGEVAVKNLATGEQTSVPRNGVVRFITSQSNIPS
ncbi:MAG: histidine--tRNA ligase [Acidobacteria bacterium]|nr:histidine--tRNA ligase [Acidobacteriota bacterium]